MRDKAMDTLAAPWKLEAAPHVLAFEQGELGALRERLLEGSPLESAAFVLARPVRTPAGVWRLIPHEVVWVEGGDYAVRTETELEVRPAAVARAAQRARQGGAAVVVVHTHPGAETVVPSRRDVNGERLLVPFLRRRIPDVPHARLILGPAAAEAALFDVDGTAGPLQVVEVGHDLRQATPAVCAGQSGGDDLYDRQVRAFGEEGQSRLARMRVGIVGLGGTGSVVAQQLAHLGVGAFLLMDPDVLERSNRNRVVGARPGDVGRPKVEVARDMILSINPDACVRALRGDVRDVATARELLDCDMFFSCTDSHGSRAVLTQFACQYRLPGIDVGVAIHAGAAGVSHIAGRVQMLGPGLPCLLCAGILDPEAVRRDFLTDAARAVDPYIMGAATPQPAVISINSTASSLAVTMLLGAVTGVPVAARHQRLRLESGVVSHVEVTPQARCPVCSPAGASGRGDEWPLLGRAA